LRHFESTVVVLGACVVAGALGCSPQVLVVVDPDPCAGTSRDGAGCGVPPGLLDDLVGYWRLDDGVGSASARDGSGRGNNGALVGLNTATAWVPGRSGSGIEIGGAGWILVTPSASIDSITNRVTIAAWVYLEGTIVNWGTAASRQIRSGIDQHYHLSLNADARPNLFVTVAPGGIKVLTTTRDTDVVAPRTWVHLAGTYDGTTARLYYNGVLVASAPLAGTFAPDTTPLVIGGNGNDGTGLPTELFPGRIDEIMLYRRALSDEEIGQLSSGALFSSTTPGGDAGVD
jgi:hypothetical protein